MPRYFKSTANKPGGGVRKGYRRGGRNLRDEEARVIGVQDNAADELRRVRARRPHDAAERRDRRAQLSRVGSRERNARDEMARLRGYRRGGPLRAPGVRVGRGPKIPGRVVAQAHRSLDPLGRGGSSRLGDAGGLRSGAGRAGAQRLGMQYGGAIARQAAAMGPAIAARIRPGGYTPPTGWHSAGSPLVSLNRVNPMHWRNQAAGGRVGRQMGGIVPDMTNVNRRIGNIDPAAIAGSVRYQPMARMATYEYGPYGNSSWAASGGRVGFKTGGRIPRKKKGAKFI